ncbi:MAG: hypothetical protein IPJ01_13125 [Micavibrio sp.]|nr:hypothetical protein [Micavibrio sp.]
MGQRLDFRQSQQLVMTPQLQQAIKLLQLNNIELAEFIEEEIAQNPLLEKAEADLADSDDHEKKEEIDNIQEEFDGAMQHDSGESEAPDFDAGSSMATVGAGGNSSFDEMDEGFESRMSTEKPCANTSPNNFISPSTTTATACSARS